MHKRKKQVLLVVTLAMFLVALILLLQGCGGDSGSSNNVGTPSTNTQTATVIKSVSGNIVTDSSTMIPASVSVASQSGSGTVPDNVTSIEITSYDNGSNIIDKIAVAPKDGFYSANVKLAEKGGKLQVIVVSQGYAPFIKVVDYDNGPCNLICVNPDSTIYNINHL